MITLHLEYFAALREQSGRRTQKLETSLTSAPEIYAHLASEHGFTHGPEDLKLAVNDEFVDWSHTLGDGDRLVFIPPVSGG